MTLLTLTDKQRVDLLMEILDLLGMEYEKVTREEVLERIALEIEYADRYEGLLK